MSTIEGMSQTMLAMECDDIIIRTNAAVRVTVTIIVPGLGVLHTHTMTYTPIGGIVSVGELGDLCNQCIKKTTAFDSLHAEQGRMTECTLVISLPDEEISSSATVLYCRKPLSSIQAGSVFFATTCRERRMTSSQRLMLYVPGGMNLSLTYKLAYIYNDQVVYSSETETVSAGQDTYQAIDASPAIQEACIPTNAELLFYDIELYSSGTLCDRVHVDLTVEGIRQTELLYINLFGVQESVLLSGDDEEEQEYDAAFDYRGSMYQKYDARITEQHSTGSGSADTHEWQMLCDLVESPAVAIRSGSDILPIVITDIEAKRERPSQMPDAITIKWRVADHKAMRKITVAPDTVVQGVFEHPIFDNTFV